MTYNDATKVVILAVCRTGYSPPKDMYLAKCENTG